MPTTTIIAMAIIVIIAIILGGAWLLYRSGFRLNKLLVKLGVVEAEMERTPGDAPATGPAPSAGIEQTQQAIGRGSLIENSPQQAGAPGVKQSMQARQGGKIIESSQTAAGPAGQQQNAADGGVIKNSSQKVE